MRILSWRQFFLGAVIGASVLASGARSARAQAAHDQLQLAKEALDAERYNDAVKLFKDANKSEHNACGTCYIGLAAAYAGQGDFDKQLESADRALKYLPDDPSKSRAHVWKGNALVRLYGNDPKKLKEAEQEFRTATQLDNGDALAHYHLGVLLLRQSRDQEGVQELGIFLHASPEGPGADMARSLIADPRRAREDFAPDFEVKTLSGETLDLRRLTGKVVVLDFWATWCPPCRAGVPELMDLYKKYPHNQLVLISISRDANEEQWRDFIARKHMEWAQYRDQDRRLARLFGIRVLPTYLVIDKEGVIRERITGSDPQQTVAYRLKPILKGLLEPKG